MKRNWDLVRDLLLVFESKEIKYNDVWPVKSHLMYSYHSDKKLGGLFDKATCGSEVYLALIESESLEQIQHYNMMSRSMLFFGQGNLSRRSHIPRVLANVHLSWAGHELLDEIRHPKIWQYVKDRLDGVESASQEVVVEWAREAGRLLIKSANLNSMK